MKVQFDQLEVGDFFTVNINLGSGNNSLLYQKIKETNTGYNSVLINTGELCGLYISNDPEKTIDKVEVYFEIRSL